MDAKTTTKYNCERCADTGSHKDYVDLPDGTVKKITRVCECPRGLARMGIHETEVGPFNFRYIL